jgi:hypothetical protein
MERYLYELQSVCRDIWTDVCRHAASCVLSCTPSLEDVFGVVDKVFWAHMRVGGSSDMLDPLVGDL